MGDRANIFIQDQFTDGEGVYLYSHWGGVSHLARGVEALQHDFARARWNDGAYLARVVFQQILDADGLNETGYGISTYLLDNEYPILVVDTRHQLVGLVPQGTERQRLIGNPDALPLSEVASLPLPADAWG